MTESEWLSSSDPGAMLRHLTHEVHEASDAIGDHPRAVQPSARKLRLFACACCRQVWDGKECDAWCHKFGDDDACRSCHGSGRIGGLADPSRRAVETAERYADGLATKAELAATHREMQRWNRDEWNASGEDGPLTDAYSDSIWPIWLTYPNGEFQVRLPEILGNATFAAVQASLLRDVFGNPFRPWLNTDERGWVKDKESLDKALDLRLKWLAWNDGLIPRLAWVIYHDREWERLPLLADVLEEAGCEDAAILGHCRGLIVCPRCGGKGKEDCEVDAGYNNPLMTRPGWRYCYLCNDYGKGPSAGWWRPRDPTPHVRGCWVIDLLLGKE